MCIEFPCDVPGPDNTTRTLTNTDELRAHRQEYIDLGKTWNPKDWDAKKIAKIAKDAGMKYVVYTTVHCDGFADWDTNVTTYVGRASEAIRTPAGATTQHFRIARLQ